MHLPTRIAKGFLIGSKKGHFSQDFRENDCPVFELYWRKRDQFVLKIEAGDGGYWSFDALKIGIYKIQLVYNNIYVTKEIYNRERMNQNFIEGLWTGMVSTRFIEFCLVQP